MHLSAIALQEFKDIYFHEYGVQLDDKKARQKAIGTLKVMRIVFGQLKTPIGEGGEQYGKTTT